MKCGAVVMQDLRERYPKRKEVHQRVRSNGERMLRFDVKNYEGCDVLDLFYANGAEPMWPRRR